MKWKLLLYSLLVVTACATQPTVGPVANTWMSGELRAFIGGFEKTAMSHDADGIMHYLDEGYVKEQLTVNLGGRTEQFLGELFGGDFREILVVRASVLPEGVGPDQPQTVTFQVTFKNGMKKTAHMDVVRLNVKGRTFALIGPRG